MFAGAQACMAFEVFADTAVKSVANMNSLRSWCQTLIHPFRMFIEVMIYIENCVYSKTVVSSVH